ncbi:MAG: NYN domain-containing protein [Caldilineales bacterium]|nr:NYN domain-containing protein [Caldilineales bacterium]MDW8318140.1 NYN domain-containing protein [Anaerolineae bacterium]
MKLLVDGHNLIGAMPDIDLADPDDEWQLVQRLRSYAAAKHAAVTVVFDSGPGPAPTWHLSGGGVDVRFAPPGLSADAVIVQLLRREKHPSAVTVVTNDLALAGQVRSAGGQVRSATQFAAELSPPRPPPKPRQPPTKPQPTPRDPAFADLYRTFIEADKDLERFGEEVNLDPSIWEERLYGDNDELAAKAARWLGRFGGAAALNPLLDALGHRAAMVRAAALLALGELGNREAVPAVAERLAEDASSMVREAAAQALGSLGGLEAEQALQRALADPKAKVRKAAAASLAQLQARKA